jgi:hypothetical protein
VALADDRDTVHPAHSGAAMSVSRLRSAGSSGTTTGDDAHRFGHRERVVRFDAGIVTAGDVAELVSPAR